MKCSDDPTNCKNWNNVYMKAVFTSCGSEIVSPADPNPLVIEAEKDETIAL